MEHGEHVSWLVTVPCGDTNFKTHLADASKEDIQAALDQISGKTGTKGKEQALRRALSKLKKKEGENERVDAAGAIRRGECRNCFPGVSVKHGSFVMFHCCTAEEGKMRPVAPAECAPMSPSRAASPPSR